METSFPVLKVWLEIDQFEDQTKSHYSTFSHDSNSAVRFGLFCEPQGSDPENDDSVTTVFLRLLTDTPSITVRHRLVILRNIGDPYLSPLRVEVLTAGINGVVHKIPRDTIIPELLIDQNLLIYCEVELLKSTKITSLKSSNVKRNVAEAFADFGSLLTSGLFSDLTLVAGEEEFQVHRAILATRSEWFARMLQGEWRETIEARVVLDADGIDGDICRAMLEFIYLAQTPKFVDTPRLLKVAHMYELDGLKEECARVLATKLTVASVVDTLLLARTYELTVLAQRCIHFIADHSDQVAKAEVWNG